MRFSIICAPRQQKQKPLPLGHACHLASRARPAFARCTSILTAPSLLSTVARLS
jgi:hypothetical protein